MSNKVMGNIQLHSFLKQNKISGVGGVHCSCCNNLRGSHKRKRIMNKMVRQILKSDLQKQIKFDDI
jgi:hypothetical protein